MIFCLFKRIILSLITLLFFMPIVCQEVSGKKGFFIRYSNYEPLFGTKTENLNNHVIVKQVRSTVWPGSKFETGIFKRITPKISWNSSIASSVNTQMIRYDNLNAVEDERDFGSPTFLITTTAAKHKLIGFSNTFQFEIWKGFFLEAGVMPAFNVSKSLTKENISLTTDAANKVYAPLLWNTSRNINKFFLFGRVGIGYLYKGFFVNYLFEQNLTAVINKFSFKGDNYLLKYDFWKNQGYSIGYMHNFSYDHKRKPTEVEQEKSRNKNRESFPDGLYLQAGIPLSITGKVASSSATKNYIKKNIQTGFEFGVGHLNWLSNKWFLHTSVHAGFQTYGCTVYIPVPGMSASIDRSWPQRATGFTASLRLQPEYHFKFRKQQAYFGAGLGISQLLTNSKYENFLWNSYRANGTQIQGYLIAISNKTTQLQVPFTIGVQKLNKNKRYWRFSLSYLYGLINMTEIEYYLDPERGNKEQGSLEGLKSSFQISVMKQIKNR
ncbi:MAG: hypothetical protein ABL872_00150 [Lacibacter sp.]